MALVKVKPTSPGRRSLVKVVNPDLHKGKPHAPLLEPQSKRAGRNNSGHITMRHQGGGHKQHYRIVDFKRAKDGISAKVERLEYDPNRSANLALLCYTDGERRYIIAPKGVAVGMLLMSGA
ncbi:MAG: 50S ribosomal protein L2, partial [Pseudomonadota bacterium]